MNHAPAARTFRRADRVAALLVLGLGALHSAAAAWQESMNEDGIGYLDAGAAWLAGDWATAINATWSPLYALLLAPATLGGLPIEWRLPVVHAVNFVIFAGAYAAFRRFWREVGRANDRFVALRPGSAGFAPLLGWLAGHALFAWAALNLVELWSVTPDMLVLAFVLAAATLLLEHRADPRGRTAVLCGVALGLGYLAKPVMFPVGLVFLGVAAAAWGVGRGRRAAFGSLWRAGAGFALVALPWMVALSVERGAVTFGSSGTLTYIRYVNDVSYPFWTDPGSSAGAPVHPIPLVAEGPDVRAFGDAGVGGTYPPGFDPAYWYEGVEPRFVARRQFEELASNLGFVFEVLVRRLGLPVGAVIVLLWLSRRRRRAGAAAPERPRPPGEVAALAGPVALAAIGAAGIALYLPIFAEGRYLAPFLVLGAGAAFALVRVPGERGGAAVARAGTFVVLAGLLLEIGAFNLGGAVQVTGLDVSPRAGLGLGHAPSPTDRHGGASGDVAGSPRAAGSAAGSAADSVADLAADSAADAAVGPGSLRYASTGNVDVARALRAAGVAPGTPIGAIGWAFDDYWAWLADLRVVAEMPEDHDLYWYADSTRRAELEAAFVAAGARWIIAEVRPERLPPGWTDLAGTDLALRRLPPAQRSAR